MGLLTSLSSTARKPWACDMKNWMNNARTVHLFSTVANKEQQGVKTSLPCHAKSVAWTNRVISSGFIT